MMPFYYGRGSQRARVSAPPVQPATHLFNALPSRWPAVLIAGVNLFALAS